MKKEALDVLLNRRSIRKFKSEQIKEEELDAVLEAGKYAPTTMGLQSPLIIAVQNPEDVKKLNKLSLKIMVEKHGGNPRPGALPYYGAPTIILVFYTEIARNDLLGVLDASAVCTNMLNAAYAVGLGSCWINRCKEIFELDEGKALLKKWGITEKVEGIASIALGYADQELPEPKPRRDGYAKIIK